ncbi:hypothetical protein GC167_10615 [bacterium]|nr:hypothetical protein [bacterium]
MHSLTLVLSALGGAAVALLLPSKSPLFLRLLLAFSGAYLLATGVLDLLPHIYGSSENSTQEAHHHLNPGHSGHELGWFILLGFLVQLLFEALSQGVEHGHQHMESVQAGRIPWPMLMGLSLHALVESLPIGAAPDSPEAGVLTRAIAVHNLPVGLVFFSLLRQLNLSVGTTAFSFGFFVLMAPLGIALAGHFPILQQAQPQLMAITFGVFLHISTVILFESSKGHGFNFIKLGVILLAFAAAHFGHGHA